MSAFWLGCLTTVPGAVVIAARTQLATEQLRRLVTIAAAILLALTLVPLVVPAQATFSLSLAPLPGTIRLDALSRPLLPLPPALWLFAVAATPKSRLDRAGLARTAVATLITLGTFLTDSPALLALFWASSTGVFLGALRGSDVRRVAVVYLGASVVLFAIGATVLPHRPSLAIGLLVTAALLRKGIFPFHAWIPDAFDRGRLGPAVLFAAPQTGAYAVAVLIVPRAAPSTLRIVAVLALVTAVYGAALALFQRDARRAIGYLFVSQSALVMAGLDCTSERALNGSLVIWLSSALAFAGIGRAVLLLEARRGRLELTRRHGGYAQMPHLAVSFLVLGLACTGFPGTLGFVGQELLVAGAVETFPILGFCVVLASALTGLAVLRMYFSLFCGRRDEGIALRLLRRERLAFAALAVVLVGGGVAPGPIVASLAPASEAVAKPRTID